MKFVKRQSNIDQIKEVKDYNPSKRNIPLLLGLKRAQFGLSVEVLKLF